MVAVPFNLSGEYIRFLIIVAGTIVVGRLLRFFSRAYAKRKTEETRKIADTQLIYELLKPLEIIVIFAGVYFALSSLSVLEPYRTWINRVFFVTGIIAGAILASRIAASFVSRWLRFQKRYEKAPRLINKIISIAIFIIALVIIMGHFNVEIAPLVATLGLGGLAIGLALQRTLSDFFAGINIISDKPISVGDFIELPDSNVSGYVEDIRWRATRIRTLPNTMVVIPNSKLAESIIINNYLPEKEMAALVQCGVAYGSDLKKVERVTAEVGKNIQKTVQGAVKGFTPFIRYHTFGDSNINFTVILRVEKFVDKYLVTHEFIKALQERYAKEGIEISWPVRKVYYGKGK